jgi:hypothetical protein
MSKENPKSILCSISDVGWVEEQNPDRVLGFAIASPNLQLKDFRKSPEESSNCRLCWTTVFIWNCVLSYWNAIYTILGP